MSTATATPNKTETEIDRELLGEVWRGYRARRAMGEKPLVARSFVFQRAGIEKSDTRERLGALLEARERERGLAASPEEVEREIEAEAAEAEGVEEVLPAEPEEGSTEAIERDARRRVDELRTQIERMAPEALVDAEVAGEQKAAESELAEAEHALTNVTRARGEITRREESAAEQAEREARQQAEAQAAKLQPQIRKSAERLDTAAGVFAESAVAYRELKEAQAAAIARTGRGQEAVRGRSFRRREVAASLFVALRERNLGGVIEGFSGSNRDAPLAAGEPEKL